MQQQGAMASLPIDSDVLAAQSTVTVDYPCSQGLTGTPSKFLDLGSASRDAGRYAPRREHPEAFASALRTFAGGV